MTFIQLDAMALKYLISWNQRILIDTECWLIHTRIRSSEKSKIEENNLQFYGPASNCLELGKLGYTLNGYYLVKSNDLQDSSSKKAIVDVVHCQFQQSLKGAGKKGIGWRLIAY